MILSTDSPLSRLLEPLHDLEYVVTHTPVDDANMVEKLFINLEIPEQDLRRRFIVELFFINDVLQAFGGEDDEEDAIMAQFSLVLPLLVPVEAGSEVGKMMGLLNRLTPLGAFGYSEADSAIYLRYTLTSESRALSDALLLQVLSVFEYLCQEYVPVFEAICEKQLTTEMYINKFSETGHKIPPIGDPILLIAP